MRRRTPPGSPPAIHVLPRSPRSRASEPRPVSLPALANPEKYMRVLCAGDEFITPQMFAEALKPHLGDGTEFVTHASHWPAEPWNQGTEVTEFAGDEGEIAELVRDADLMVTHLAPVTERVLNAARRLRLVAISRGG